jgi:hypothetical protein
MTTSDNQPKAVDEIRKDLDEIAQRDKEYRQKSYDEKIRSWLSPADPEVNYMRALRMRHSGSGAWFLQSQEYIQWKSSPKSSLWLHGLAGCGKTVLLSSIVEDLHRETSSDSLASSSPVLLNFFFDFRDGKKQSLTAMALSFAHQLYHQDENFRQPLDSLYKACNDGYRTPSTETLLRISLKVLKATGRKVYLVLDALDECVVPRQDLLAWIQMIAKLTDHRINMLVTSRKELEIASFLGLDNVMDQTVAVQSDTIDADIRAYISDTLRTGVGFKRWESREDVQQMIRDSLFEQSDGM